MTTIRTRFAVLATAGVLTTAGLAAAATTAAASSAPRCGNGSLAVTRTYVDSGAGHSWMALIYRNTTSHSCTVFGYPGLDAIGSEGHVLAHAARSLSGYGGGGRLGTVTIRPNGYASAGVEWLNFNGRTSGSCRFSAAVNTIVANTTRVHRLSVSVSVCKLQVHPTVGGTPRYPNYGPAQRVWIQGSKVDAADMNYYLRKAEQALKSARVYPTQVHQLAQLASLPDTGLTPTQIKLARADVKSLDNFFATPGLYF